MARILLIDDSPSQLMCMNRVLSGLLHDVVPHSNPHEALATVEPAHVDLVFIELLMLRDNGFEIGLQLREKGHHRVLLLTGTSRETDRIWARALGIGGVLTRPLPPQRLQEQIDAALAQETSVQ